MDIIEYWSQCSLEGPDFIHPQDRSQRDRLSKNDFPLDLIPVPYAGDLRNARIVIAMMNPRLPPGRLGVTLRENPVYAIEARPEVRSALTATLYQQIGGLEYPFMFLDPAFRDHPGYLYWDSRMGGVVSEYAKRNSCSPDDAKRVCARRIATLERVPYHSVGYRGELHRYLPSAEQAVLAFREQSKRRRMIVPRAHRLWGLDKPATGQVSEEGMIWSYFNQQARLKQVQSLIVDVLSA